MISEQTLSSLEGQIAWMPRKGVGTFITIEFGSPHLVIREAIKQDTSSVFLPKLSRRDVTIVGEQHLWLQADEWRMHGSSAIRHSSDEPREIKKSLEILNGQRLLYLRNEEGSIDLRFEYGDILRLCPASDPEQVQLTIFWYQSGNLSLLSNGKLVREGFLATLPRSEPTKR